MECNLEKLRYDLALLYAKSKFEIALNNEQHSELSMLGACEGHLDMRLVVELDALIAIFGRAYRELSLITDKGLLEKMNLKDEFSQQDSGDIL